MDEPEPTPNPLAHYETLSDKHRAFVDAYITGGYNATRAAREAGYKNANIYSARLVKDSNIAAAIKEQLALKAMGPDEILAQIADIARGDASSVLDEYGNIDVVKAIKEGKSHLIKRVKFKENFYGEDKASKEQEVELYDKLAALVHLGKGFGLWKDVIDIDIDFSKLTDEQLRILAKG